LICKKTKTKTKKQSGYQTIDNKVAKNHKLRKMGMKKQNNNFALLVI